MQTNHMLARRLRDLRKMRGMTQAELALKAGIGRVYIANLEAGRHDPRVSVVVKLARALNVNVAALLE